MADLAARLAALSPEQRVLLTRRLAEHRRLSSEPRRLPRQAGVNTFRTSFAQERLWVLEHVAPGSAVHNVVGVFRAVGRLDLSALRQSLESVIARHESLRTTFAAVAGVPFQVISPVTTVSMPVVDLRDSGAADTECIARVHADIRREAEKPFDVAHGPLLRAGVFILGDAAQMVWIGMHHLIADAWSATILVRELTAVYRACVEGGDPGLPAIEIQYADYAQWQREQCQGEWRDALVSYWHRQLSGAPYLEPSSGVGRAPLSVDGVVHRCDVPSDLVEAARALGRREGVTLFVVLLAVWQMIVSRWTGQVDVTVISPIANRARPVMAEMIGFFVNLVALRTRVDGDLRFRDLLVRAKDTVRGAHRHQELPFEMVVKDFEGGRSLARPPISPVGFTLERGDLDTITLPDVELHAVELDMATSKTDVALIVRERGDHMSARLECNRDLFDATTIDRVLGEFLSCLVCAVGDPGRRVSELLPETQPGVTVWERFTAQVAKSPEVVAIRDGAEVLTYRELAARAMGIAGRLQTHGVERQAIVGVWGERGVGLLSAMLGIFRVGGVYLPLDPSVPAARVAHVLQQSGACVVLTGPEPPATLLAAQEDAASWTIVPMDVAAGSINGLGHCQPSDLAYVIYTSGSSGEPKGAMIEHAGLLNHLEAKIALLELHAGDCVAQTAAAGFDISVWQYLAVLLVGGRVEVVAEAEARDPRRLREAIARAEVTVLEMVPPLMRVLLEAESAGARRALGSLRWLVVTGDALAPELCRQWWARYPTIPLVNAYGPTECADDVTHHVVRTPPEAGAVRVPIGRPIANMAVHVLDAALVPVAVGEVGELCVGGIGVGRGYLHDPVRTAAAFVPDPFAGRPEARLYRTGDRGRRLPDGTLECLGRLDQQVKIRGMRVEPGEIEAVLLQHPAVRQAAVVARRDRGADPRLVAYVTALDLAPPSVETLRRFLVERLPDSMVPSAFVLLETLPLGPNGKIDRRALPDLSVPETDATLVSRPPVTVIECLLAGIWSEVLQVEVRCLDDDFFALGGDSLSSIRVVAQARRHGVVLTPPQIFEHRTIARLAGAATTVASYRADQDLVTGDVALTPIQRALFEAELPDVHHYNMAVLLEVDERLAPSLMAAAVEHLLRHHDALRLRVRRDGEEWRASIAGLDGAIPFSHVDVSSHGDAEIGPAIEAMADDLQASLNLVDGPILRVTLFDLGPGRPERLLIVIHHLACDVVSWPILLEDLASLYDQLRDGDPIALPAKTTSYQQWAERLFEWGRLPERRHDLSFWQGECGGPCVRLPRDLPGAGAVIADVAYVRSVLTPSETELIRSVATTRHVSVEVVLLTGLATALTELAGGDTMMVYLERHGREAVFRDLDVSRTVGWFTAVFPLRLCVDPTRRSVETLGLIDRHLREIPSGGVGYGVLWCGLGDPVAAASLRALPRPEVSFNYLGSIDPPDRARWRRAHESPGRELGRHGVRPTILDVTAHVADATLQVAWAYSTTLHRPATIERLAARFLEVILDLTLMASRQQADAARPRNREGTS